MKNELITDIVQQMLPYLDNSQTKKLQQVLEHALFQYEIIEAVAPSNDDSENLVNIFIAAKRIEGCSEKTLKYYQTVSYTHLDVYKRQVL